MHEERYNTRLRHYSAWHRRLSTGRFVGIENAQLLAMIDLDASLYVEYDDGNKIPLALIETAQDVGQDYKNATVTANLAKMANLPCFIVLYKVSAQKNPADISHNDIEMFRVKKLHPKTNGYNGGWVLISPRKWAEFLLKLRRDQCSNLDIKLFGACELAA
jgi:hypothetical protein